MAMPEIYTAAFPVQQGPAGWGWRRTDKGILDHDAATFPTEQAAAADRDAALQGPPQALDPATAAIVAAVQAGAATLERQQRAAPDRPPGYPPSPDPGPPGRRGP